MFEPPGPPLEITIALTAGRRSVWGVSSNAIGIVGLFGLERSSGTATVPHRAFAAAVGPHFANVGTGAAAATPGTPSAATVTKHPKTARRPIMAQTYNSRAVARGQSITRREGRRVRRSERP